MGYLIKHDKLCFYLIKCNNSGAKMISPLKKNVNEFDITYLKIFNYEIK